jgi:hypothetical protein
MARYLALLLLGPEEVHLQAGCQAIGCTVMA